MSETHIAREQTDPSDRTALGENLDAGGTTAIPLAPYGSFVQAIDAAMDTDVVPFVPDSLMHSRFHIPLFATLLFNPAGPTLKTISLLSPEESPLPDVVVRRDG